MSHAVLANPSLGGANNFALCSSCYTVESVDGVQEVGCGTSSAISNEHLLNKVAANENTESGTGSGQLQGNVENKVLEEGLSLSTEKHSISVKARLYIFTSSFFFYLYQLIIYIL